MENLVRIKINSITLEGMLAIPKNAKGIVLLRMEAAAVDYLRAIILSQLFYRRQGLEHCS